MTKLARAIPRFGEFIPTMQPSYAAADDVMEEHGGKTWADIKYDGYRVQIHKSSRGLKVFTRNGNELNYQCYPEVLEIIDRQLPSCIVEAELVGKGSGHKEVFDNVKKRFRRPGIKDESMQKYLQSGIVNDVPLELKLFDTLKFERKGILYQPIEERRKVTESLAGPGIEPADTQLVTSVEDLVRIVDESFDNREEGRICKKPGSLYLPGKRTLDWVKFKRSETLDLTIVGFYVNEDLAHMPFTSVLVAAYNDKACRYETLGKVGVTRESFANDIHERVKEHMMTQSPTNVAFSEELERPAYKQHVPDLYINPENSVVLEVKTMNLNYNKNWQTCGRRNGKAFSMRIGYVGQLRPDKSPRQSTTTEIVRTLYEIQEGI
jgi:ATP-dependent DNA ligase